MTHETELAVPVMQVLSESLLGELTTTEIRREVKRRISMDSGDFRPLRNRKDRSIDQKIRNLKCHRSCDGNPFREGYLVEVPRGCRITEKGRLYLLGVSKGDGCDA